MKRFRGAKKVIALALCGLLCITSAMPASAAVSKRIFINDSQGKVMSSTLLYRNEISYSVSMSLAKDSNGRNKYTGEIDTDVFLYDAEIDACRWDRDGYNIVYSGYTANAHVGRSYANAIIQEVHASIRTGTKSDFIKY